MFIRRIFVRKRTFRLWRKIYVITLRGMGILNHENEMVSGELHFLRSYLGRLDKAGVMVFDVGANVGKYAKMVRNIRRDAIIHCFEPHPKTFATLEASMSEKRTHCYPLALGDEEGSGKLFDYKTGDSSTHASLYRDAIDRFHGGESICHHINVTTLDSFVQQNCIEYIDLLKIDTEGNELRVLQGGMDALRSGKIGAIQFEFTGLNIYSGTKFKDFVDLLDGYNLYRMLPDGLVRLEYDPLTCEIYGYQNIVAFRQGDEKIRD